MIRLGTLAKYPRLLVILAAFPQVAVITPAAAQAPSDPSNRPSSYAVSRVHRVEVPETLQETARRATPSGEHQAGDAEAQGFPSFRAANASAERTTTAGDADSLAGRRNELMSAGLTVASSLAMVLALFAGFVWMMRKFGGAGQGGGELPKEVFDVLGSKAIDPRTRITLARCGQRILVLSQSAASTSTLAEISNPDEVREIAAACTGASKSAFTQTLEDFEREPAERGFTETPRGRLFATA